MVKKKQPWHTHIVKTAASLPNSVLAEIEKSQLVFLNLANGDQKYKHKYVCHNMSNIHWVYRLI